MSKKSLILVILQFSCFLFFAIDGMLFVDSFLIFFQLMGLIISFWGMITMKLNNFNVQPEVKQNAQFISKGPYRLIRNPMYAGILIFFGIALYEQFSYLRLFVYILLTITLLLKIYAEEKFLTERFGDVYLNYKEKTSRLIPFIY